MPKRSKAPPPARHELLVVVRVRSGKGDRPWNRRWLLADWEHGEYLFKSGDSLRTAREGFYTMTGFTPRKVIKVSGVHTHARAQELVSAALR